MRGYLEASWRAADRPVITAAKVGVPESLITMLGTLNAAAAFGLLLGLIGVPLIGTAAAIGLVL